MTSYENFIELENGIPSKMIVDNTGNDFYQFSVSRANTEVVFTILIWYGDVGMHISKGKVNTSAGYPDSTIYDWKVTSSNADDEMTSARMITATLNFQLIVQLHINTMQRDLLQIEKNKGMTFRLKENLSRALSINGDSIEILQITLSKTGCQIDAALIASDDSNKENICDYTDLNELPVVILDNGIQRQNSLFHLGHATNQQLQKGFGNSLANAAALLNNRTKDMLDRTPIVMPDLTNNSPGHSVSNKFPTQPWIKNGHLSVVSDGGNHSGNNNHNHHIY